MLCPKVAQLLPSLCVLTVDPQDIAQTHGNENASPSSKNSVCCTATELLPNYWSLTDVLSSIEKSLNPVHEGFSRRYEQQLRALEARVALASACGRAIVLLMENLHALGLCHLLVPQSSEANVSANTALLSLLLLSESDVRISSAAHVKPIGTPCPATDPGMAVSKVFSSIDSCAELRQLDKYFNQRRMFDPLHVCFGTGYDDQECVGCARVSCALQKIRKCRKDRPAQSLHRSGCVGTGMSAREYPR